MRPFLKTLILFACMGGLAFQAFAQQTSCATCHTDEKTLKTLFVPPELSASEGEG